MLLFSVISVGSKKMMRKIITWASEADWAWYRAAESRPVTADAAAKPVVPDSIAFMLADEVLAEERPKTFVGSRIVIWNFVLKIFLRLIINRDRTTKELIWYLYSQLVRFRICEILIQLLKVNKYKAQNTFGFLCM